LASLDRLSGGRLLVTLVPGLTYAPERDAVGVEPRQRGAVIDDALPLLRRLWAGETVSHDGPAGRFRDVLLSPRPVQEPLEMWLGGTAPAALERCGRLSDGWLPSLCTPEEAAAGRRVIEEAAARAGRTISPEHFGLSVGYASVPLDPDAARARPAPGAGSWKPSPPRWVISRPDAPAEPARMIRAVDVPSALAGLTPLQNRSAATPADQVAAAFAVLAPFR